MGVQRVAVPAGWCSARGPTCPFVGVVGMHHASLRDACMQHTSPQETVLQAWLEPTAHGARDLRTLPQT